MLASRDGCTILYSFNHNNSFLIAEQTASPPPPGSKRGNTIRLGRSRGEGANRVASRKVKIGSWKTVEHPSTTSQTDIRCAFPFCSVVSILTEVLLTRLRLDSGHQSRFGGGGGNDGRAPGGIARLRCGPLFWRSREYRVYRNQMRALGLEHVNLGWLRGRWHRRSVPKQGTVRDQRPEATRNDGVDLISSLRSQRRPRGRIIIIAIEVVRSAGENVHIVHPVTEESTRPANPQLNHRRWRIGNSSTR
ncbi:hypothetical protein C8Q69DRAFT_99970 [Paecilomyces variotii]|uniref:Uncharacterized protein n=1 Tax=Byssochlamys spectabilis TaxID=264951 RepID=A0A443HKZ6_BYSSP|nr:hypothetical protein C8Q69DRAFT_99970 [Paecilomyces variotii]RWQ92483.1 hypothetical protein C8Q69DRAFT_99970 [Paecilomyces variotii]